MRTSQGITPSPSPRYDDFRPNIGIIGAGALGTNLAAALAAVGWRVDAVCSRSNASAQSLAARIPGCVAEAEAQSVADRCRIVFLTVPDDAIAKVASSIEGPSETAAVHCSGAGTVSLLSPAVRDGAHRGSLHPLQSFVALPKENAFDIARARLKGVTFAVEGSGWLREALEAMASDLGGHTIAVDPSNRPLYHASAVMSCGILIALLRSAASLWQQMGIKEDEAFRGIFPLARTTLENAADIGPQSATTGPVPRGDVKTIRQHLEALAHSAPEVLPLYVQMTRASISLSSGIDPQRLCEMATLLSEFEKTCPSRPA